MNYIIIVAGGKGLRMGTDVPKQFLPIGGKPVLMRTIERFHEYDKDLKVILVLPESEQEYWRELCKKYDFIEEHQIANGGETRFHSSKNGLDLIPENEMGLVDFTTVCVPLFPSKPSADATIRQATPVQPFP